MKTVTNTLGISRSNLVERLEDRSKPRGACHSQAGESKGNLCYRRIAALLNRERRAADDEVD